jgi:ribosomal protein S18 acetylase RimI-like enzyme
MFLKIIIKILYNILINHYNEIYKIKRNIFMENCIIERLNVSNIDELNCLLLELADHHNKVSKYFQGKYPYKPFIEFIAKLKDKAANGISKVDVIRLDKKIVAFAIYFVEDNMGILEYLVTSANSRNKGYGKELMDNIMAYFKEKNVERIEIRIVYGNDDAKRFYNRYGFQTQSEILALYCK